MNLLNRQRIAAPGLPPHPPFFSGLRLCAGIAFLASPLCCAPAASEPDPDLYALGKNLFDSFAPDEIKEQYEFASRAEWDRFFQKLESALQGDSFEALAACEPEARSVLEALRLVPAAAPYADWLAERLEMIEVAKVLATPTPPPAPAPKAPAVQRVAPKTSAPKKPLVSPPKSTTPSLPSTEALEAAFPGYSAWLAKLAKRPRPPRANEWLPTAQQAFLLAKIPPELAWIAEIESSFNPSARSPAGAVGLYQLTAPTAKTLGLSTWMPDQRLHPAASARAAALLLGRLNETFHDWALSLAAYNAGEGRLRRALAANPSAEKRFAAIARSLPVETRLYATLVTRNGQLPSSIIPSYCK